MSKIFTSDLHFLHKRICEFSGRPWLQEDNTEKLIALWNDQVGPDDEICHLGDFAFVKDNVSGYKQLLEIVNHLNGIKRFLLGNHDSHKQFKQLLTDNISVVSVDTLREIKIGTGKGKKKLVMCHYPMATWNQSHNGSIQIHGHEHGRIHNLGKSIDVGLDGAKERLGEWRFWTEQDILDYASKLEIHDPSRRERP